jgi:hypothetical protein
MALKTKGVTANTNGNGVSTRGVTDSTIKIKCATVNHKPASSGSVTLDSASHIDAVGIGLLDSNGNPATARFTLVGKSSVTRIAKGHAPDGSWCVRFDTDGSKTYYLTCTSDAVEMTPPLVKITVQNPTIRSGLPSDARIHPMCQFNPPSLFSPNPVGNAQFIAAVGTVLNAQDSVTCNLTPINDDGTSRGPSQTSPANMNGYAWSVNFTPTPPNVYSGLYLVEATAPNEGTASASVDV